MLNTKHDEFAEAVDDAKLSEHQPHEAQALCNHGLAVRVLELLRCTLVKKIGYYDPGGFGSILAARLDIVKLLLYAQRLYLGSLRPTLSAARDSNL
jgi:hypothetical protein